MLKFGFILLAASISLTVTTAADVNCTHYPQSDAFFKCCTGQSLLMEAKSTCDSKLKDSGNYAQFCVAECIFNDIGLVRNGQILMDKARSVLTEIFKNAPELIPVMEEALKKCDAKVKDMKNDDDDGGPGAAQRQMMCNLNATETAACAIRETFVNCPSSRWQNTQECNHAKQFFEICVPKLEELVRGIFESENKRENVNTV